MSPSRSSWMNVACLVCGVVLGLAGALFWGAARSDDAELRAQLDALAQRLAALDARLDAPAAAPAAGLDALQMRQIVRSALDDALGSSSAPGDVARARSQPEARSEGRGIPLDQDTARSVIQDGNPQDMQSLTREVVRSLNE